MKKILAFVLAFCIIAALFVSCSAPKKDGGDTSLKDIKDKGVLVVGTSADYAPYEFHIMDGGVDKIVGFDIDLAQAIADALGVKLEIQDADFDGLLSYMNAGKVDIVIAGLSPSPERAQQCDFSDLYYLAEQGVLIKKDKLDVYTSFDALKGLDVGAQMGTIQEDILNEQVPDANPVIIKKIPDLVLELQNNKVDAVIMEVPVAEGYAKRDSSLVVANIKIDFDGEGSAIAVKKGSKSLLDEINKVIADLTSSGKFDEFVFNANELATEEI